MSVTDLAPEGELQPASIQLPAIERRTATLDQVEFREQSDRLIFQGHAAVFDRLSEDLGGFRERIKRGAFRKALDANPDVVLAFNHNFDHPMARTTVPSGAGRLELREDPKGLRVYAELAPTTMARDLRTLVQTGVVRQMSFGWPRGTVTDEWRDVDGMPERTITEFRDLIDVSPVTFAAYVATDAAMRSICGIEIVDTLGEVQTQILRDLAWKIHRAEQDATVEERAALDAAFARIEDVSPWMAERAFRAASQEPELLAAIPGKRVTFSMEDVVSGGPAYRLAARKRRLRAMGVPLLHVKSDHPDCKGVAVMKGNKMMSCHASMGEAKDAMQKMMKGTG